MGIEWTEEQKQEKAMIERALDSEGFKVEESDWSLEDDRPRVALGKWEVIEEDEDRGLYLGDEGTLSATCVGGKEYGNLQVAFYFLNEDFDSGGEKVSLTEVSPL